MDFAIVKLLNIADFLCKEDNRYDLYLPILAKAFEKEKIFFDHNNWRFCESPYSDDEVVVCTFYNSKTKKEITVYFYKDKMEYYHYNAETCEDINVDSIKAILDK